MIPVISKIVIMTYDSANMELIQRELKKGKVDHNIKIVQIEKNSERALHNFKLDMILSNYVPSGYTNENCTLS